MVRSSRFDLHFDTEFSGNNQPARNVEFSACDEIELVVDINCKFTQFCNDIKSTHSLCV